MIKAAFFDLDGTLVSFKTHQVSEGTIRAFDRMHALGIRTFLSTGRPICVVPQLPLSFDGHVTMNGGYCFVGDKVLFKNPIPLDESNQWIRYAEQHNICTLIFTEHDMFVNPVKSAAADAVAREVNFPIPPVRTTQELLGMECYQAIAVMERHEDQAVAQMLPHCRLPRWHDHFTDVINVNNSKAVGIQSILDHFGLTPAECIAFGDGENDLEMLQYCGIGVAMGNSRDAVKAHADYVTTTVDDEGVLNALQSLSII